MSELHQVQEFTKEISEKEFKSILIDNDLVVVDCYADWCSPCLQFRPIFEKLSNEYTNIKFISIDTDGTQWIGEKYDIDSIPRFLFFKNAHLVYEHKGASPLEVFEYFIKTKLLGLQLLDEIKEGITESEFEELIKEYGKLIVEFHPSEDDESEQLKPFYIPLMENYPEIKFLIIELDSKKTQWARKRFNIKDHFPYFIIFNNGENVLSHHIHHPEAIKYAIEEKLLGRTPFTHDSLMPEEKFDTIINAYENAIVFIMKEGSNTSSTLRNYLFHVAEKFPDLPMVALKLEENPWLVDKFGLEKAEFTRYGEEGKKIPYFIFYKNSEIVHETGPVVPTQFEDTIQGKLLKLFAVDEYDHGLEEGKFNTILENPLVIMDIFTVWCQPCIEVRPIFRNLSRKYSEIKFLSVDLDHARWIGEKFDIDSIPSFLFFKDGEMVHKHVGFLEEDMFEKKIQDNLK
ncbi:MAG: hypothetical protein JW776_08615 [Candidatus Lokiarchaeota archaeon]|nr:hypothetical protein [Candidatus Lokiarchaeota archaeon]